MSLPGGHVPGAVVPNFLDPAVLDDPFEAYTELHERCPVFEMPQTGLFLVTRYEDARMVLTDTATFSSRPSPGASRQEDVAAVYRRVITEGGWARTPTLQRTDPPTHTRYRQLINIGSSRRRGCVGWRRTWKRSCTTSWIASSATGPASSSPSSPSRCRAR